MSEMIKEVGSAALVELFGDPVLGPELNLMRMADPGRLAELRDLVGRAAIAAMRKPTDRMIDAGSDAMGVGISWSLEPGEGIDSFDAMPVWQAMLDAALSEDSSAGAGRPAG